jgi:hypothetical protein
MAHEVVLDHPHVVDANAVGELHLLDDIFEMRVRILFRGQIRGQIEEAEFHLISTGV